MPKLNNKIIAGEIGFINTDEPINTKKEKGVILNISIKQNILSKKQIEKIWLSMNTASMLGVIPKEYGLHTVEQNEAYIKKYWVGKTLTLNLNDKPK